LGRGGLGERERRRGRGGGSGWGRGRGEGAGRREKRIIANRTAQIGLLEPKYNVQKMQQAAVTQKEAALSESALSKETVDALEGR